MTNKTDTTRAAEIATLYGGQTFSDSRVAHAWLQEAIAQAFAEIRKECEAVNGSTSDGYHTFDELYEHRHALFANIAEWKSKLHEDGTMFDGWFIAGLNTSYGQITYHIPMQLWDLFNVGELPNAPKWDGHTSNDVILRLRKLAVTPQPPKEARAMLVKPRVYITDSMIEAAAMDLANTAVRSWGKDMHWKHTTEAIRERWRSRARSALIAAFKEQPHE